MYLYRREDNDQIVEVDFATMMSQVGGYITLPDGVQARRCVYLESQEQTAAEKRIKVQPEIVSDTLGVTDKAVNDFRANAEQYGYRVEFKPDPTAPEDFYEAHFPSWREKQRYAAFRGLPHDLNGRNGSGATLSPQTLERAKQRLLKASE